MARQRRYSSVASCRYKMTEWKGRRSFGDLRERSYNLCKERKSPKSVFFFLSRPRPKNLVDNGLCIVLPFVASNRRRTISIALPLTERKLSPPSLMLTRSTSCSSSAVGWSLFLRTPWSFSLDFLFSFPMSSVPWKLPDCTRLLTSREQFLRTKDFKKFY